MPLADLYVLLGLPPEATHQQIEQRIRERLLSARRQILQPGQGEQANQLIQQLREARLVLLDPKQRARYDQSRRSGIWTTTQLNPVRPAAPPAQPWNALISKWLPLNRTWLQSRVSYLGVLFIGFCLGWIVALFAFFP